MKKNSLSLIIFFLCSSYLSFGQNIKSNHQIINNKSCIYYYPECIETYEPMTTEGIMESGPYNRVFMKINPIFFQKVETLLKQSYKIKNKFWAPSTVLKLSYTDTVLYLTIDSGGNFVRSDENKSDSLYQCNDLNLITLMEKHVDGFKKYHNRKYVKAQK